MKERVPVLGVMIDPVTMEEAVNRLEQFIKSKTCHQVATVNAEMVMLAKQDEEFAQILRHAALVVPDGAGVVWAARRNGFHMPERVAGYDLAQQALKKASEKGYRVFFFGGAPGIAEQARKVAEQLYNGITIVGTRDGFFRPDEESEIVEQIRLAQPEMLLAALGVPKQEKWLYRNLATLDVPVSIGIGGTFDVMAGVTTRAPLWVQRSNLEWLYRLLSQPRRIIRMMALPRFVYQVLRSKNH